MEPVIGVTDRPNNGLYNELQVVQIPILPGDDLLPVPLVHIDGVDIVQLLIPTDGVHIGVQAVANGEMVSLQSQALPLGQGVHHLGILAYSGNIKADRPLIAVQIVVQAGIFGDEQGGGHALQVQRIGKFLLEGLLDVGNGPLGVIGVQRGRIVFGDINGTHCDSPLSFVFCRSLSGSAYRICFISWTLSVNFLCRASRRSSRRHRPSISSPLTLKTESSPWWWVG